MDNPVVAYFLTQPGGLADRLRTARIGTGKSGRKFATDVGMASSKVSRVEAGKTIPSPDDIRAWGRACGLDGGEIDSLLEALEAAKIYHLQHRTMGRPRTVQSVYNDLHAASTDIVMVESVVFPGPLQTVAYAREILTFGHRQLGAPLVGIEEGARSRADRGRYLDDEAKRYRFVVSTVALETVPNPEIMRPQLEHVLAVTKPDRVSLVLVPPDSGVLISQPFAVYDSLVIIETMAGTEITHDASEGNEARALVDLYRQVADRLAESGAGDDDSRAMIERKLSALDG